MPRTSAGPSFPSSNPFASLMLSLTTFGAGFLMRPLGAIVLGNYIDRHGRRRGLILTLWLMAAGTASVACVPGYATIGIAAPLLVLAGRSGAGLFGGRGGGRGFGLSLRNRDSRPQWLLYQLAIGQPADGGDVRRAAGPYDRAALGMARAAAHRMPADPVSLLGAQFACSKQKRSWRANIILRSAKYGRRCWRTRGWSCWA